MTTEQKAVDLINEVRGERKLPPFSIEVISRHTNDWDEALCRAIEAIEAKDAEIERLREALREMFEAVCGETGFAQAVRADSGFAYPWPALDLAEAKARAALKETGQ